MSDVMNGNVPYHYQIINLASNWNKDFTPTANISILIINNPQTNTSGLLATFI
jgi:hypothetical protein